MSLNSNFVHRLLPLGTVVPLVLATSTSQGQVTETLVDFEPPGFDANSQAAVGDAGFDFFFSSSGGTSGFPDFNGFIPSAPGLDINNPSIVTVAFDNAAIAGSQSLVFFADVNSGLFQDDPNVNADPRVLNLNVFQQQTIAAEDIGKQISFSFLFSGAAGALNTADSTRVEAFLLTLDPNNNFAATNNLGFDLSGAAVGETLSGSLNLDLSAPELEGQILQFGLRNSFADGQNPAVIVDNLALSVVPEPGSLALLGIGGLALIRRRRA